MAKSFVFTPQPDGGLLTLEERKLLRRRHLPLEDWGEYPAAPYLRRLVADNQAQRRDDGLFLPTDALLACPEGIARMIGLPPIAAISLAVSLKGRIETPDGELRAEWHDPDFRPLRPERQSLFVRTGEKWGRLSAPVFRLVQAIEGYNATVGQPGDDRIPAWILVQNALEAATGEAVKAERLVRAFRIHQAGAFGLDVRESINGPVFDPILMAHDKRPSLEDLAEAPEVQEGWSAEAPTEVEHDQSANAWADDEHGALLAPDFQKTFAKIFSSHIGDTRASYVVGPNTYVVIAPELRRALDVVRRVARSSAEERRTFVRNPRSFLAEDLADLGENAGCLFVETHAYSSRVIGLGLWEKPTLPWGQRKGSGWLPEQVPLTIGDKTVVIEREELPALGDKLDAAEAARDPTVTWKDVPYPTQAVRTALEPLRSAGAGSPSQSEPEKLPSAPSGVPDKNVLRIKTNFDDLEYNEQVRRHPKVDDAAFPVAAIPTTKPKPHQEVGFRWLAECWAAGRPGVLLADDMGLGKTLQALAFLAWVKKKIAKKGPILIVAPTALLRNWQAEAERHLVPDALGTCVEVFGKNISSLKRTKDQDWTPEDALDGGRLKSADWILTTYETLANYHRAFARIPYPVAVFDEMQKIKAPDTINTHAAKTLNIDFVLGLTGTPIENRIEDLWCLMDRIHSGLLGSLKEFSATYGNDDPQALRRLKTTLDTRTHEAPPILLRRMKEDHLPGLPARQVKTYRATMPSRQAQAYEDAVTMASSARGRKHEMLKVIHALRGISLHPRGGDNVDPYDSNARKAWIAESARTAQALDILRAIKSSGDKALVFIEDRSVQRLFAAAIAQELNLRTEPDIINGASSGDERQRIVDKFQAGPPGFDVLVLSPKAAGIGLTITAANHVIHLSRWWNPAVEDQCNDRVYRIGQEKSVTIHIPQAIHPTYGDTSFDIKLDLLLAAKRALSRDMLAPPVGASDVETLFKATVLR